MKGIDVSENNGTVNWSDVAAAGFQFAIIRLGWGHGHLDSEFYNNVNGAIAAGLKIGVYYYSYATTQEEAEYEANYIVNALDNCGLTADKLPMGIWIDEEDADGWRQRNGLNLYEPGIRQKITNMISASINILWDSGLFPAGYYCNLDWLENYIDRDQLKDAGLWLSHPGQSEPDYDCMLFQYSFNANINGHIYDADEKIGEW
jgi:lysozyme